MDLKILLALPQLLIFNFMVVMEDFQNRVFSFFKYQTFLPIPCFLLSFEAHLNVKTFT